MQKLYEALNVFNPLLDKLLSVDNAVIGGSHALIAHGLKIGREPQDIDIIIYMPTKEQIDMLYNMSFFEIERNKNKDINFIKKEKRSWKFKRNNIIINIILERNKKLPTDLMVLHIPGVDLYYRIQSISNIIDAKNTYTIHSNQGELYARLKDIQDLIILKELNFNSIKLTEKVETNNCYEE